MGTLHKGWESEQGEECPPGGLQGNNKMSPEHLLVSVGKSVLKKMLGTCQKDTEPRWWGTHWSNQSDADPQRLPSPGGLVSICVGSMGGWVCTDSKRQWAGVPSLLSPSSRVSSTGRISSIATAPLGHCASTSAGWPWVQPPISLCLLLYFPIPCENSFLLLFISKLSYHPHWVSQMSYVCNPFPKLNSLRLAI